MFCAVAGCSPPEHTLVAVYAGQGSEIRARLRACPDSVITSVKLMRLGAGDSGRTDAAGLEYWSGKPPKPMAGEEDMSLSSLPADWHADILGTGGLSEGETYSLSFTSGKDDFVDYRGKVEFSTSDVAGLSRGDVWADGKRMSLKEFREKADDSC
jgi:hypothetical protein